MNRPLNNELIRKDDAAMDVCSLMSFCVLTNRIWAFFSRLVFEVSKIEVMARKRAHTPICALGIERIRMTKLMNPKKVSENRCRNE